ncbi:MAG: serine hydrolase, partial [Draconibacterium sp.]|nr:serine hydrolase [Draconibacterium sp.]
KNGKIRWAKGYGIANINDSSEVKTNTLFQAGSISKPIAALAALKLVQEGKIDLDEDVNTYLKDGKFKTKIYGNRKSYIKKIIDTYSRE